MKDAYTELKVNARSELSIVVDVPEGIDFVGWDWLLTEFSLNFVATFQDRNGKKEELQRITQHEATAGPCVGAMPSPVRPGRLELVFDNSFSKLRGKTVHLRLEPSSLKIMTAKH